MTYRNPTLEIEEDEFEQPSWREEALCKGFDPDVFFPDEGDTAGIAYAKSICEGCPVIEECLSYAVEMNQTEGIWGGTTKQERRRLRRRWLKELKEAS